MQAHYIWRWQIDFFTTKVLQGLIDDEKFADFFRQAFVFLYKCLHFLSGLL